MNYGPLVYAIESLLRANSAYVDRKDERKLQAHDIAVKNAWLQIGAAQDQFFEDVKNGRIEKGD